MRFGTELSTGADGAATEPVAPGFAGLCFTFAEGGSAPATEPWPSLPSSAHPHVYTSPDAARVSLAHTDGVTKVSKRRGYAPGWNVDDSIHPPNFGGGRAGGWNRNTRIY